MRRGVDRGLSYARGCPSEGILLAVAEGAGLTNLPELYGRLKLTGSGLWMIDLYDPGPHHLVRLSYRGNRY